MNYYIRKEGDGFIVFSMNARQRKMARDSGQTLHEIIAELGKISVARYGFTTGIRNPNGIKNLHYYLIEFPKNRRRNMYIAVLNSDFDTDFDKELRKLYCSDERIIFHECFCDDFTIQMMKMAREEQPAA